MALLSKSCQNMLEELRNTGNWCCIKIMSDYDYVWDVILIEGYPYNDDHKITIRSGSYEDLNDAVVSAYKKAQTYIKEKR